MNTEADLAALCDEFTKALTEVLAENAAAPARRGRVARAHAAVKRHSEYNEHCILRGCGDRLYAMGGVTKRRSLTPARKLGGWALVWAHGLNDETRIWLCCINHFRFSRSV
jgi:hypothetical protein